jgi:hypothetical protein
MKPRGVSKLIDLDHNEFKSTGEEDFTTKMQKLHN